MNFDELAKEIFDIKMKIIKSGKICDGINYDAFVISYPEAIQLLKEAMPEWDKEFSDPIEDIVSVDVSPFCDNAYGLRSTKVEGSRFYMRLHEVLEKPKYFMKLMKAEEILGEELLGKDITYGIEDDENIYVSAGIKVSFIKNGTVEEIVEGIRERLCEL